MGDGIQKKHAIIINGDAEARHLGNVDRAIKSLKKEDSSYRITVVSPKAPAGSVSAYNDGTTQGLKTLLSGLKMDDDDLLVVYLTGHGGEGKDLEGCIVLKDSCYSLNKLRDDLSRLQYGKRIVVMDQCNGGGSLSLFANAYTQVVTQGAKGQQVICQAFAPFFWSDTVTDRNHDGVITVGERYDHAIKQGQVATLSQYFNPQLDMALSGKLTKSTPFKPEVVEVHHLKELQEQFKNLGADQLALVMFSADWCEACTQYAPTFEALSKQYGGRFLMIRAEGINGSEKEWKKYNISSYPSIRFFDSRGKMTPVLDRNKPLESHLIAVTHGIEEQLVYYRKQLNHKDRDTRLQYINAVPNLGALTFKLVPDLIKLMKHPDFLTSDESHYALSVIAFSDEQSFKKLLGLMMQSTKGATPEITAAINSFMGNLVVSLSADKGLNRYVEDEKKAAAMQKKMSAQFFKLLTHTDPQIRQLASEAITKLLDDMTNPKVLNLYPQLEELIPSKDITSTLEQLIAYLLAHNNGSKILEATLKYTLRLFGSTKLPIQVMASRVIGGITKRYSEEIVSRLKDNLAAFVNSTNPTIRFRVVDALTFLALEEPDKAAEIHRDLRPLLKDPDENVRLITTRALVQLATLDPHLMKAIVPDLQAMIGDQNKSTQIMAHSALSALNVSTDIITVFEAQTSHLWQIAASPSFAIDTVQGAGFKTSLDFGYRFKAHWSLAAQLGVAAFPEAKESRLSFAAGPRYHIFKQPAVFTRYVSQPRMGLQQLRVPGALDPYVILPAAGLSYGLNPSGDDISFLALTAGGLGLDWYMTELVSFNAGVQAGVAIPLDGSSTPLRARIDVPLGIKAHF